MIEMKSICFVVLLLAPLHGLAESQRLDTYQVLPINSPFPIEPSGLTLNQGRLLMICDDANVIFELDIESTSAQAKIFESLDPKQLSAMNLDLEGITFDNDDLFVVSESYHKLIRISEGQLSWVPDSGSLYQSASKQGLFQIHNAGLESSVYLGDQTFLLSVEREPRGLVEVKFDPQYKQIISQFNQVFDDSEHLLQANRKPDLTGLFVHDDVIYALHRNAYQIHELIKKPDGHYAEGKSWSYEHIVKHPDNAYQDMKFGHAEGLAVDDDNFYLVLDNNNNPKAKQPNDARPLLIIARRK